MIETVALAPGLVVPRIINGMWQVAGAHGPVERNAAIRGMVDYHRAGLVAWDMADIYGPAEEWYGAFRDGGGAPGSIGLTKMVPAPGPRWPTRWSAGTSSGRPPGWGWTG